MRDGADRGHGRIQEETEELREIYNFIISLGNNPRGTVFEEIKHTACAECRVGFMKEEREGGKLRRRNRGSTY